MDQAFFIKQGDTSPSLIGTLVGSAGTAQDLTSATVRFSMRTKQGIVVINRATVTVLDALAGRVRYDWLLADTATSGDFYGEFEVTFTGGAIMSFPNYKNLAIRIAAQIA
jgi:hypothetical protein